MDYKLYTLVDITHTGQHRIINGQSTMRNKEQNFQTVLQTLGMRANIIFKYDPKVVEVKGKEVGFDTNKVLTLWEFEFESEKDDVYDDGENPVGLLVSDFSLVPYINGLDEKITQEHAVFRTAGADKNIVFQKIQ